MTTELYRSPTRTTQDVLGAGPLDTVFPPARFPFAQILYLRDVRRFYMRVGFPTAGTAAWELMGGPGAALGWPKYVVNVAGQQPVTPYTTIQSAIDAAVADGHGPDLPTQVLVFPGVYAGDVTMTIGIHVAGLEGCQPRDTIISGQMIIAPPVGVVTGSLRVANLNIHAIAKPSVAISDAGRAQTLFANCSMIGDGAEGVLCSNTNGATEVNLKECTLAAGAGGIPVGTGLVRCTAAMVGICLIDDSDISVNPETEKAIQTAAALGTSVRDSQISGRILVQGGTVLLVSGGCDLVAVEQAVIEMEGNSNTTLEGSGVTHTSPINSNPTIAGLGTFRYGNVTWFSDRRMAATVTTVPLRQRGPIKPIVISLATVSNEIEDAVIADTGAGGIAYTLPNLDNVYTGETTRIVCRSGAGGLTITPAGADTLDVGGVADPMPLAAGSFREYVADPVANNWVRIL